MSANIKRRRSSFGGGRKSLGTVELNPCSSQNPGVDNYLWEGLSEDEKRRRLCIEEALLQLRQEMPHLEEFDQFMVHVRSKVNEKAKEQKVDEKKKVEEKMEEGVKVEEPVKMEEEVKRSTGGPVCEAIDQQMAVLPGYIEKLKAEKETWDEMVRTRELLTERAQAQAEAVADHPIEFGPTLTISEADRKLLSKKPDYSALHRQVLTEFEVTAGIMEEIPKFLCALDRAAKSVEDRLKRETLRLHEELFPPSEYNPLEILYNRLQDIKEDNSK